MKDIAFLIDVDNTLIDNDKVKADLVARIDGVVGKQHGAAFWKIYEDVRGDLDYVDLPQTLSRFKLRFPEERGFPMLAALVLFYPFENCLFPGAPEVVQHLKSMGAVAILSDGDPVFQPAKIARAGLYDAVDGKVMVYPHKEDHLQDVQKRVPARRYVVIDDKPNILSVIRRRLKGKGTSVHVCQGKYALASQPHDYPDPDIQVQHISDLLEYESF